MPLEWGGGGRRRVVKGEKNWDNVASARESEIY